jgi:hypothetical protein
MANLAGVLKELKLERSRLDQAKSSGSWLGGMAPLAIREDHSRNEHCPQRCGDR